MNERFADFREYPVPWIGLAATATSPVATPVAAQSAAATTTVARPRGV